MDTTDADLKKNPMSLLYGVAFFRRALFLLHFLLYAPKWIEGRRKMIALLARTYSRMNAIVEIIHT